MTTKRRTWERSPATDALSSGTFQEWEVPPRTGINFHAAVDKYYDALYRFAYTLDANEAADLTQNTFHVLLQKSNQIRDPGKLKSWLFTVLHRQFLQMRKRCVRHPQVSIEEAEAVLPPTMERHEDRMDASLALSALHVIDEKYRTPLALFYLGHHSYKEIALALDLPMGTVMSRLARGKSILRRHLSACVNAESTQAGLVEASM